MDYIPLRMGATGPEVREVQRILQNLGYLEGQIDGKFEVRTQRAVISFQCASELPVDGIVAANTWIALEKQAKGETGFEKERLKPLPVENISPPPMLEMQTLPLIPPEPLMIEPPHPPVLPRSVSPESPEQPIVTELPPTPSGTSKPQIAAELQGPPPGVPSLAEEPQTAAPAIPTVPPIDWTPAPKAPDRDLANSPVPTTLPPVTIPAKPWTKVETPVPPAEAEPSTPVVPEAVANREPWTRIAAE